MDQNKLNLTRAFIRIVSFFYVLFRKYPKTIRILIFLIKKTTFVLSILSLIICFSSVIYFIVLKNVNMRALVIIRKLPFVNEQNIECMEFK